MTNQEWGRIIDRYIAERRTVSGGKGEQESLKKQELANQAQEMALQQQALAMQQKFAGPVLEAGSPYLTAQGQGFTPEQLAAMNTQFLNSQSQNFGTAESQVMNALRARGFTGNLPSTGEAASNLSSLFGLNAATTSAGLTDIQLQNSQQALANKFNTMGIFAGTGGNYGNQAVGLGNTAAGFGSNAVQAGKGTPFLDTLANLFTGVGNLAKGIGSNFNSSNNSSGTCWIAETIYGKDDTRTSILRAWLNQIWAKESILGKVVMTLYRVFGRRVAKYPRLCRMLKPLFDHALRVACDDERMWA